MTDIQAQYDTVRNRAGLINRSDVGKIAIYGQDSFSWLQGMVSNDTRRLTARPSSELYNSSIQACILDATGHILTDLRLLHISGKDLVAKALGLTDDDFILMDLPRCNVAKITTLLERFIITEDVEVVDVTNQLACFSVQTVGVINFVQDEQETGIAAREINLEPFVVCVADHSGTGGRDFYTPTLNSAALKQQLLITSREIGPEAQELLRVEAGIPRYGVDMDETTLAPEAGLMATHISLTKGCYVGQEIVARIDSRGHTNRALTGLVFEENDVPASGDKIFADEAGGAGRETGRITSVVAASPAMGGRPIALGYVRHEHRAPGSILRVQGANGARQASVVELPFYRRSERAPEPVQASETSASA